MSDNVNEQGCDLGRGSNFPPSHFCLSERGWWRLNGLVSWFICNLFYSEHWLLLILLQWWLLLKKSAIECTRRRGAVDIYWMSQFRPERSLQDTFPRSKFVFLCSSPMNLFRNIKIYGWLVGDRTTLASDKLSRITSEMEHGWMVSGHIASISHGQRFHVIHDYYRRWWWQGRTGHER